MKDRKKYIAEFLAESEKIIKILEIVLQISHGIAWVESWSSG